MLTYFFSHINTSDNSINVTMEKETNGSSAFLDILITRLEHGQLSTKMYRKPAHTGKCLRFRSEHPLARKCAVLNTLLQCADKFYDRESERQEVIDLVRSILRENGYPNRMLYQKKHVHKTTNEDHERRGLVILSGVARGAQGALGPGRHLLGGGTLLIKIKC